MLKRIQSAALVLLLATASLAFKDTKPHFLAPADVDWKSVLTGPPAAGSAEAKTDLDTVLEWQKKRTDEEAKRCKSEAALSPTAFQDVLGDKFDAKALPLTFKLLKDVGSDTSKIADEGKEKFKRLRPPAADDRVKPCVPIETNGSYPSSHGARGEVWGKLLAELYPEQKEKLIARGKQIGEDRVIGGIHFPTDVAAGQKLGDAIYDKLMTNDEFKTALAAAKAEIAAAKK